MYDILYSVENKERYLEFVSFSYTETRWGSKQHGTTLTVIVWKKKEKEIHLLKQKYIRNISTCHS